MTIAFSEKFNSWTTRYSFEPTCYSTIGNSMISFNDNGDVWLHDSNDTRCQFYEGVPSGASIEVVSNQDPSAIKMFKSLSVETNASGWSGKVYTNDEYSGNEKQEGDILESFFKNKEGFKYSEMPRSKLNSSVVQPAGGLKSIDYISGDLASSPQFSNELDEYLMARIADQGVIYVDNLWERAEMVNGVATINENPTVYFELPVKLITDLVSPNSTPMVQGEDGSLSSLEKLSISGVGFSNGILGSLSTNTVRFSCKINDFEVDVIGGLPHPVGLNNYIMSNLYSPPPNPSIPSASFHGRNLFSESNSEVNGDQMRGPYARIKLNTQTTEPFELHAINVDYEFSKLDNRLTQNS